MAWNLLAFVLGRDKGLKHYHQEALMSYKGDATVTSGTEDEFTWGSVISTVALAVLVMAFLR